MLSNQLTLILDPSTLMKAELENMYFCITHAQLTALLKSSPSSSLTAMSDSISLILRLGDSRSLVFVNSTKSSGNSIGRNTGLAYLWNILLIEISALQITTPMISRL